MVEQAGRCRAEWRLGHPTQLAPFDLARAALVGRIVGADRDDPTIADLNAQRLFGIGGEYVEHLAPQRHLAGLVDPLIGDIAQVEQHRVKLGKVAGIVECDAGRLGGEGLGRGQRACQGLAGCDDGNAAPVLRSQSHLDTMQRRHPLPDIGGGRRGVVTW